MAEQVEAQSASVLNGMPWWVKAFAYVGFPVALSVGLLWYIFTINQPHIEDTKKVGNALGDAVESLAYTNFIMCQRSAANQHEKEKCIKPPDWTNK